MVFSWTPHRFSGGALAFDLANSVILRFDPARRVDRFADPEALEAFTPAAAQLSADAPLLSGLQPTAPDNRPRLIALRESIDVFFRSRVLGEEKRTQLAALLDAASHALRHAPSEKALEAQSAYSAMRLLSDPASERTKICGQCGWLFLDRSRNRTRFWCDMAVCGNRAKASRHYQRRRAAEVP